MVYVKVEGGVVTERDLPPSDRKLDTQEWVMGLPDATDAERESCGWFLLDETAVRPADTATTTFAARIDIIDGRPVRVWIEEAKSAIQLERERRNGTRSTLEQQARTAYTNNADWLSNGPFTSVGTIAQVQDLTRQINGVIRVLFAGDLLD